MEGYHQTYGVGMPIILYFDRPIREQAAVERALDVRTSKPVVGAWYWDGDCGMAPTCLYFRPRRYWPAHTAGHLHRRTSTASRAPRACSGTTPSQQSFTIGSTR